MKRRVAIVTGASSGIGRALTERAVRAGWDVYAVGRRAERLDELKNLLGGSRGTLATLALDLRTPDAARRIVREALDRFGQIDVLVNNAGGVAVGAIAEQPDGALYEQMETHVIVPLALARECLPALRASKGLVIFFGSGVARIPVGTLGAYPPAKAAVRSMSRIARNELRTHGIAVTYVDPGAVATEFMTRAGFAGPPPLLAASPYAVARRVFAAFTTRRPVVNAVPWQTFFVAVGEALPALTDFILSRAPQLVGGAPSAAASTSRSTSTSTSTNANAAATSPAAILPTSERSDATPSASLAAPLAAPNMPSAPPATPSASLPAGEAARTASNDERGIVEPPLLMAPSLLERALEVHERRMKKLNLRMTFVRGVLVPGDELELGDVAMHWAGMPNKNERALTSDVLEALAEAGYVERLEGDRYRVIRAAED